jgi:hypothetical protein
MQQPTMGIRFKVSTRGKPESVEFNEETIEIMQPTRFIESPLSAGYF